MPSGILGGIFTGCGKELVIHFPVFVLRSDQHILAEVEGLHSELDIGAEKEHKPKPGFTLTDIRDAGIRAPVIDERAVGELDRLIIEIPVLGFHTKSLECPRRNVYLLEPLFVNRLEKAGLQDYVWIDFVYLRCCFGSFVQPGLVTQPLLAAPAIDSPSDIFHSAAADEFHLRFLVGNCRSKDLRHSDGTGEVIVKHFFRNRSVKFV